jgi:membrane-bound lytic murein transglycosylase D
MEKPLPMNLNTPRPAQNRDGQTHQPGHASIVCKANAAVLHQSCGVWQRFQRLVRWTPLVLALPLLLSACTTFSSGQSSATSAPVVTLPASSASAAAAALGIPAIAAQQPSTALTVDSASGPGATTATTPDAPVSAPTSVDGDVTTVPVDPLRPEVRLDLDDRSAQTDLWVRVRRGFAMPDLTGELVRNREQSYASNPEYVQRMTERGGRYLFHILEELERRKMPTELALLPFIESAFNPQAMSSARASGMWQFMPSTGKHFALKHNIFRDDRRDVLASTRAALDYLSKLHGMFGNWQLALAAYNWGEGSVQRAIAYNKARGLPTDYINLRMPNETRYYVPKLQAVKNIVARPADYNITLPALRNHPYFLSVPISRDMDVAMALQLSGLSLAEFQSLNPQMNRPVILAAGTPQVLLPYDNANQFVRQLSAHRGPLASWTAWVAPQTLRTSEAARRVGMDEAQLREVNRIPPRMLVKAGSTLVVPRVNQPQADVSIDIADNATMAFAPDLPSVRKTALRAGQKDTVASIAKRYRTSAAQVASWNRVSTNAHFKPGQTVVLFVATKNHPTTVRNRLAVRHSTPKRRYASTSPRRAVSKQHQGVSSKRRVRVARK